MARLLAGFVTFASVLSPSYLARSRFAEDWCGDENPHLPLRWKDCPTGLSSSCINDNKGYKCFVTAYAQCLRVNDCEFIGKFNGDGMYYLRRRSDPDGDKGSGTLTTVDWCQVEHPILALPWKDCPSDHDLGSCINGNKGYRCFETAYAQCMRVNDCEFIGKYKDDGMYYLRRRSDPDNGDRGWGTLTTEDRCQVKDPNLPVPWKDCPSNHDVSSCINGNKGYRCFETAYTQCMSVKGCEFIGKFDEDGMYYLRRRSDPDNGDKGSGMLIPEDRCQVEEPNLPFPWKDCPSNYDVSSCINGNKGYRCFETAYARCTMVNDCEFIGKFKENGMYYLRRRSDPDDSNKGSGTPTTVDWCQVGTPDLPLPWKNCPNGCINNNIGYRCFETAYAQCVKVEGCEFIGKFDEDGMYYLRRRSDPDDGDRGAGTLVFAKIRVDN